MRFFRAMLGVTVFLLTVGALAAGWAYFEWLAPTVPGKIVDKQERIAGSGVHSSPGRYLSTAFTLKDDSDENRYLYGSPHVTDINVDQPMYERLAVGASVNVKYLPINPAMARLDGQPLVPLRIWQFAAAILLALAALLLLKRTRMAVVLCAALAAALLVAIPGPPSPQFALSSSISLTALALFAALLRRGGPGLLVGIWILVMAAIVGWPMMQAANAETLTSMAQVRGVSAFRATRLRTGAYRWQGFDRVHAAFVPQGAQEAVYLLDFVDQDSVAGLAEGANVTIEYTASAPEAARLVQGRRTHYWKNAMVPVGAVLGLAWLVGRKKKTKQATPKTQSGKAPRRQSASS